MGLLELVLVVFLILLLFGGGYGWQRRGDLGLAPSGLAGLLLVIVLIVLLVRLL